MILRLLVMAGLLTLPFGLLAVFTGKAEGLIWLMLPFVFMLPVLFVCALIFSVFENASVSLGLPVNIVVPTVGGMIGLVVVFVASQARTSTFMAKLQSGSLEAIGSLAGVVLAGAVIGLVWRMTPRVIEYFGWSQ